MSGKTTNGASPQGVELTLPAKPSPSPTAAELEEFRELKGRFLACLNHEIRTPLTGIMGMMELLEETGLSGLQQEYTSIARTCAQQLYEVLTDTLEFASLTAREIRPVSAPFALRSAIQSTAVEFEARAAVEGLEFHAEISPAIPEAARGDEIRLRRLLEQLLSNAIKFTPKGRINLRIEATPRGLASQLRLDVYVTDTGIGVPPEKLGAIFESFEQVDGGLSRGYQGLGLGLALVKEMVTLLGGEIQVHSEVGKGSTFHAWLPLEAAAEISSLEAQDRVHPGVHRVLLVEDNRVSQRIVTHMLQRAGFEADIAASGPAALRAVSSVRYDLILMDLQMPGMDGIETTLRIRKEPGYAEVPVVALTANSSPEFQDLCFRNGLQAFLSKPIHSRELLETVRRFTAR